MAHFPTFKTTSTVVLRNPGKPDYLHKANAHQPITLENTLGKVLESIISVNYLTEAHDRMPPEHFGGRPEDVMIILSESIHAAWNKR